MTRNKKSKSNQDQPNLPMDITRLIMKKIPWKERLRLSLVCKSWKELFDEIQDTEEFLPWVMCYDWDEKSDGGTCKLCDPSTQTSYIIKEPTERELFVGAELHDSRRGWVLFSKEIYENFSLPYFYSCFFLYSPFTNEIIKFPKLRMDGSSSLAKISSNSGLPHCIVVSLSPRTRNLRVKICHPGDESWSTFEVSDNMSHDISYLLDVIYTGEVLYCLFSSGNLGAFDMKQQQWKLFLQLPAEVKDSFSYIAVTFNGDLILLNSLTCRDGPWCFWWLDLSGNKWVVAEHEIIKKQVMFIGSPMFSKTRTSSFSVPALGNSRASAGMIFCSNSYSVLSWSRSGTPKQSKDYEWIDDDNGDLRKFWIQPPFPNPLRASNLLQNKIS